MIIIIINISTIIIILLLLWLLLSVLLLFPDIHHAVFAVLSLMGWLAVLKEMEAQLSALGLWSCPLSQQARCAGHAVLGMLCLHVWSPMANSCARPCLVRI